MTSHNRYICHFTNIIIDTFVILPTLPCVFYYKDNFVDGQECQPNIRLLNSQIFLSRDSETPTTVPLRSYTAVYLQNTA